VILVKMFGVSLQVRSYYWFCVCALCRQLNDELTAKTASLVQEADAVLVSLMMADMSVHNMSNAHTTIQDIYWNATVSVKMTQNITTSHIIIFWYSIRDIHLLQGINVTLSKTHKQGVQLLSYQRIHPGK